MSTHVGRIPLVRRRRRKRPNRDEFWLVAEFLWSFVRIAIGLVVMGHVDLLGRGLVGAIVVLSLGMIWVTAPVAVPALRRWLWGE